MPDLSLEDLRARWKALFGHPAPLSLRRRFLARAVAYQMQVVAYGGLSASTQKRLQAIAAGVRQGSLGVAGIAKAIRPGAQMLRQWKDQTHSAMITLEGIIIVVCLSVAAALTVVGTYYVVNWASPPITQTMPSNR